MNNPNCWRVPIPTDILTSGLDIFSQMLYIYILVKCTNKPYTYVWMHGNKRVSVKLDRGQCLLNVSEIERMLNLPQRTVKRCIKLINESTNELQIESKPYCTIVTVKNYDEVIKMPNESTNESTNEVQTKYRAITRSIRARRLIRTKRVIYLLS